MKISLEWLGSYLPGFRGAQAAGEALTHGGLPVEVFEKHGDDDVIDVEVTSNRGDCLSHVGVARELAALLDRPFADIRPSATESATPASHVTSVRVDAPDLCPNYTARVIKGVRIGPSPAWMVRRLEAVGLRAINNVVDVTNYVMFEMGQPLHAFDFDKLAGQRIIVRRGMAGEKLVSLDGKTHTLSADMLVIADAEKAVALAGIMGGQESEVTGGTVNLLLESARFDPLVVRKTARALAMKSDSSYRFERGIDPTLQERASLRAAQLILETAGGELLAGAVGSSAAGALTGGSLPTVAKPPVGAPAALNRTLRLSKLKRVLGIDVSADEAVAALRRLQFSPTLAGDQIDVIVPSWRLDIHLEIDLVEEVARIVGYARIPMRNEISIRLQPDDPAARTIRAIRDTLVAGGYYEAVTFSFVSDLLANDFKPAEALALPRADAAVRKADATLRPSILPGLLEAVARNDNNGNHDARLFEIGSAFWTDQAKKIIERRQLGLVGSPDLCEVRGVVEEVLARLDVNRKMRVVPADRAGFTAGACGCIEWSGEAVGWIGRIDRAIADKLSLRDLPAAAELDMALLISGTQHVPQQKPLPTFPVVARDLSLVVTESTRYEQIDNLIRAARLANLEEIEFVTTYRGKPLEKGTKSVTLKLVFRAVDKTLTGEEVDGAVKNIVQRATVELGAILRV